MLKHQYTIHMSIDLPNYNAYGRSGTFIVQSPDPISWMDLSKAMDAIAADIQAMGRGNTVDVETVMSMLSAKRPDLDIVTCGAVTFEAFNPDGKAAATDSVAIAGKWPVTNDAYTLREMEDMARPKQKSTGGFTIRVEPC